MENALLYWPIWVSEWLLFNTNSAIFQLYYGENKLIFNRPKLLVGFL